MREDVLENPVSIYEVSDCVQKRCRDFASGEMLDDDELDRLCDAVLGDLSDD